MNGSELTRTSKRPLRSPQEEPGLSAPAGFGLKGRRVVVTRSATQADEMVQLLNNYGAVPVRYPCIEIIPPEEMGVLDSALLKASKNEFEWLVITSANTVEAIVDRLDALEITLGDLRIAAIGPKSAESAREHLATEVHFVSSKYVAEALVDEMEVTNGQRILLPQSEVARPILADRLTERGAVVSAVVAYRTVTGQGGEDVPSLLASRQIEAITFTSASTVHYFLARLKDEGADSADLDGICLAAIGPVTADALREVSLPVALMPSTYTVPALVDALEEYFLRDQ
ncbi:MAG: uroporphyrinogen-III synthase [Candidatus Promineifilaceae bacterium]